MKNTLKINGQNLKMNLGIRFQNKAFTVLLGTLVINILVLSLRLFGISIPQETVDTLLELVQYIAGLIQLVLLIFMSPATPGISDSPRTMAKEEISPNDCSSLEDITELPTEYDINDVDCEVPSDENLSEETTQEEVTTEVINNEDMNEVEENSEFNIYEENSNLPKGLSDEEIKKILNNEK